jgi:hypothetical protein
MTLMILETPAITASIPRLPETKAPIDRSVSPRRYTYSPLEKVTSQSRVLTIRHSSSYGDQMGTIDERAHGRAFVARMDRTSGEVR